MITLKTVHFTRVISPLSGWGLGTPTSPYRVAMGPNGDAQIRAFLDTIALLQRTEPVSIIK